MLPLLTPAAADIFKMMLLTLRPSARAARCAPRFHAIRFCRFSDYTCHMPMSAMMMIYAADFRCFSLPIPDGRHTFRFRAVRLPTQTITMRAAQNAKAALKRAARLMLLSEMRQRLLIETSLWRSAFTRAERTIIEDATRYACRYVDTGKMYATPLPPRCVRGA